MSLIEQPEVPEINDARLGKLGALANKQVTLQVKVNEAENNLKDAKKQLAIVAERDIPELMAEIGINSITTMDDHKILVKEIMTASISKDRKPDAIKWLSENGLGYLISSQVVASFGKGDEGAIELARRLVYEGFSVNTDEKVNTSSVKASVKELLERGEEVPFDLFGINIVKKSIIK